MNQSELPRWKCHKVVEAAKITKIAVCDSGHRTHPFGMELTLDTGPMGEVTIINVTEGYVTKHAPHIDGYYVRYADGYESYSPAKAFEDGYTLVA